MYDRRQNYCARAFVVKIYVNWGNLEIPESETCLQLDTSWQVKNTMDEIIVNASCEVFHGSLVVAGGTDEMTGRMRTF